MAAPTALAQDAPPPIDTVPAQPPSGGGNPGSPDPAPQPPPPPAPPSSPPAVVSPPPPVFEPPPPVSAAPSGPTAAELRAQRRAEARRQAARRAAIREAREKKARQALFKKIRQQTKKEAGEGYGWPEGVALPTPFFVPRLARAVTDEPAGSSGSAEDPASEPVLGDPDVAQPVANVKVDSSGGSSLNGTAPILLGLFGLSVILLGLAAIPPWHVHGALAGLLVRRRFELGMLGTAVLVSAAIGLVISVAAS